MYWKMQESGLTKSFLSYASLLSGASILHFSPPEFLSAHHKEGLQPDGCPWTLLPECPWGSGIHIWKARITNDCEILVYWYGKTYSISHLCSWQPPPAHLPADSSGHPSLTLALSFRDTLLALIPSSKAPPHLGLKDCMAGSVFSLLPHWERAQPSF